MDDFCEGVVKYMKSDESVDRIVALTLRDIFLNELIYVQYFDVWKQYDTGTKKWSDFPVKEFHEKLTKLRDFFTNVLPGYLDRTEVSEDRRTFLKKYTGLVEKYMKTTEGERDIIEQCKVCFHITV